MDTEREKIQILINTDDEANIDLAIQLSKGVGLFEEFFGHEKILHKKSLSGKNILSAKWNDDSLMIKNLVIDELPKIIFYFEDISALTIHNSFILKMPYGFSHFSKLTSLRISKSSLEKVPALPYLTHLDLSDNNLNSLPDYVSNLHHLGYLRVSGNQLNNIDNISLPSLKIFLAGNNKFTAFPQTLFSDNIRKIHLPNNGIYHVPKEICNLHKLKELNLHGNQIATLPREMGQLRKMRRLILTGNHIALTKEEIQNWFEQEVEIIL